jgi:GT2 family glycosyltransferase
MMPLVSVLMPLFNAVDTLPFALASLLAQTYENWECIVVDDGSTDDPAAVIEAIRDPRIRFHCLKRNHGRGYARQHALVRARGKYITFLDGDDWIFPSKFREQLELLMAHDDVAIVSTGMTILNHNGDLVGVRTSEAGELVTNAVFDRPRMPPLAFSPSMMETCLAKETGFDPSFPTAEDVDFLLRALLGKRYAVLPAPLYAYREQGSATLQKSTFALSHCCRMFMKHFDQFPKTCTVEIAKARGKQSIYYAAAALGLWEQLIARRSRPASTTECREYQDAWTNVNKIVRCSTRPFEHN